ncbi:VOC family protein [Amycolatopsis sp. CA-230715]|uniref:VOC family protein n=1 Tax=Amycolatopsis sp. CA-230715 TaxID=2745196 RepID=UPI001C009CF8|nr:VOC family protein [Amycolatopsis sp. CA-230715]QWF84514.1 hypothetical protein HUW46_07964 [Amycolatopsis sp. CA-230715]
MSDVENTMAFIEISSDDPATIERFYSRIFGWRFDRTPGTNYGFIRMPGEAKPIGRLLDNAGATPNWGTFGIGVSDAEEICRRVKAAGGEILDSDQVFEDDSYVMRGARFRDPSGNLFAVGTVEPKE